MPVYHLSLWSNDLGRVVECDLGEACVPARLEEFDEAGRCALRLSASALRTPPLPMAPTMGWTRGGGMAVPQ